MTPEEVVSKINNIRGLISANKIDKALDDLTSFAHWSKDKNIQNSIILICANYHQFREEKNIGISNDLTLRNTSIYSLLEILDEIERLALGNAYKKDNELTSNEKLTNEEINASYKLLLRDVINYNNLNEGQKEELYMRTLLLKKVMYNDIDSKFRTDYPNIIFNRIFFSKDLDEIELKELLSLPNNNKYQWYEKNIVVSALSLSLIQRFEVSRIDLLLNFINAFEDGVWQRALVGLTLGLYNRDHKLLLYPNIIERLKKLQEIKDIENGFKTISSELNQETYRTCYAKGDNFCTKEDFQVLRKVENWFLPFYPENPVLKNMIDRLPNVKEIHLLPELLVNDRHLSHSQKYVIALILPKWDKEKINEFIESLKGSQYCQREHIFDSYIADFYWFFNAFPSIEFENIFNIKMKIYETSLLDILVKEKNKNYVVGNIELDNQNFTKALFHFQEMRKQEPPSCHLYCRIATTYFGLKNYKKCIQAQKKAFALDNEHFHSFQMMLSCYLRLNDWTNAYNCFEILMKKQQSIFIDGEEIKRGEEIIFNLGVAMYKQKEYIKCQFVFEVLTSLEDSQSLGSYYSCLGYCYFLLDDNENCIINNNIAIEMENNSLGYKNLAHLALSKGNIDEAIRLYSLSAKYSEDKNQLFELLNEDFEHLEVKNINRETFEDAIRVIQIP